MLINRARSTAETSQELLANRLWLADANVPDVLDMTDYLAEPTFACAALDEFDSLEERIDIPRIVRYPKGSTGYRAMVVLNPIDEIAFRRHVEPLLPALRKLRDEVLGTRVASYKGTWRAADWRAGQKKRRIIEARWRSEQHGDGIGRLDVKDHYPTITLDRLARVFRSLGCEDYDIESLSRYLRNLSRYPGIPSGLPVGPEASAPLGTAYLTPVDRRLRATGVKFTRWIDDVAATGLTASEFCSLAVIFDEQLMRNGQRSNQSKAEFIAWHDPFLGQSSGADGEPDSDHAGLGALAEAIDTSVLQPLPYILAGMRARADASGVELLLANSHAIERMPKQTTKYLGSFSDRPDVQEWAFATACAAPARETESLQIHATRIVGKSRRGVTESQALLDLADSQGPSEMGALRAHQYHVALSGSGSERWRRRACIERVVEYRSTDICRGLIGGLRNTSPNKVELAVLQDLAKTSPLLGSVVAQVAN